MDFFRKDEWISHLVFLQAWPEGTSHNHDIFLCNNRLYRSNRPHLDGASPKYHSCEDKKGAPLIVFVASSLRPFLFMKCYTKRLPGRSLALWGMKGPF